MRRELILAVVFFGGLWGLSEATLGNALYSAGVPYASVPLTIIGVVILAFSSAFVPRAGAATLIASCAMLYKFLNAPFFGCHLLGILLTGMCYDVFFNMLAIKRKSLAAALAVYASYTSFAILITYGFRYAHWVQGGLAKMAAHVGVEGSLAALACVIAVPLSLRMGSRAATATPRPIRWHASMAAKSITGLTLAVWLFGVGTFLLNYGMRG